MRTLARLTLICLVVVPAALLQSCSEPLAPGVLASLQIGSGDGQTGVPGDSLALPLDVFAADPGGRPVRGVTVTWTVTFGNSTVNPVTSTTGSDGHAVARIQVGSGAGTHRITATATGADPVVFRVNVVDACDYLPLYTIGVTASGSLTSSDCRLPDNTSIDFYALDVPAGTSVEISMTTAAFDAFLFLFDSTGGTIAADDDSGDSLNSRLRVLLGPGRYTLGANAFDAGTGGAYQLTSRTLSTDLAPCEVRWVVTGFASGQDLTGDLCSDPASQPVVADQLLYVVRQGAPVTIRMTSAAFTARIRLYNDTLALAAEAVAAGPSQPATLIVSSAVTAVYVIQFGSTTGTAGAYTMSVVSP